VRDLIAGCPEVADAARKTRRGKRGAEDAPLSFIGGIAAE